MRRNANRLMEGWLRHVAIHVSYRGSRPRFAAGRVARRSAPSRSIAVTEIRTFPYPERFATAPMRAATVEVKNRHVIAGMSSRLGSPDADPAATVPKCRVKRVFATAGDKQQQKATNDTDIFVKIYFV
jgi:hypothetical protein